MRFNKKGEDTDAKHVPAGLLLVFFVLIIGLFIFTNYSKAAVKGLSCAGKGICKSECSTGEVEYLFELNYCKDKSPTTPKCCIPKDSGDKTPSVDTMCAGDGKVGNACGADANMRKAYVCDEAHQCVARCEFCAKNPSDPKNCNITVSNKQAEFNDRWACGCTLATCTPMSAGTPPTCIKNGVIRNPNPPPSGSAFMCSGVPTDDVWCCLKP